MKLNPEKKDNDQVIEKQIVHAQKIGPKVIHVVAPKINLIYSMNIAG